MRLLTWLCLSVALLGGCGRKHRVSEVSVSQSGIEIVEPTEPVAGWPAWRGPATNGVASAQNLVTRWDESTNVRWRCDLPGRGHSSPIVVDDTIYLATALEDKEQQMVMAVNRADGSEKWTTVVHQGGFPSSREVHSKATHANGTVACNGTHLFIAFLNSDKIIATALDLQGEIVWQRELGDFVSKFGYAPSPVLYKSLVIFAADNQGGGYLAAVDSQTGEIAWRVARGDSSSYSSPTVANVGGRDQLLISGGDAVVSYDPATGKQYWRTPCISDATCGTIVTSADKIYASGGYPAKETICLSAEGKKIWSNNTKVYEPSLILVKDYLITVNDDGIAFCWSAEDGDQHWKRRLGGNFSASPISVGRRVYVSNLNGEHFVFNAGEEFKLLETNQLGNDCYASPAAVDAELFLRVGIGDGEDRREQLVCLASAEEN